jgi:hypothetical protein
MPTIQMLPRYIINNPGGGGCTIVDTQQEAIDRAGQEAWDSYMEINFPTPPTPPTPTYALWLASATTEATVALNVAAYAAWIIAHPPIAD